MIKKLIIKGFAKKGWFIIVRVVLMQILFMGVMPVAFAESPGLPNEIKLGAALALAGVVTVSTLVVGARWLMGDSAVGLIDKTKDAGKEIVQDVKGTLGDEGDTLKSVGRALIDHAGATADQKTQVILGALDSRIEAFQKLINPVSHAQTLGDSAVRLIKNVLTKATHALNENTGFTDLEQDAKMRFQTALQKTMQELDKTGDVNNALMNMTQDDLELLGSYTWISREPSFTGSMEMVSVMEPLYCGYPWIFPVVTFVLLVGPFSVYIWIKIKQTVLRIGFF